MLQIQSQIRSYSWETVKAAPLGGKEALGISEVSYSILIVSKLLICLAWMLMLRADTTGALASTLAHEIIA
jgi:hypothetical protein